MASPKNPTYPVSTIAKLLMMSERRVQQLSGEGVIPKADRGRYELAPAVQGYIRYLQERMAGNAGQVSDLDYHREKTRKIKAEADIAELEADLRQGQVIEIREARQLWSMLIAESRAKLLNHVPARAAAALIGITEEAEIKQTIRREIALAMRAVSEADVDTMFSDGVPVQQNGD